MPNWCYNDVKIRHSDPAMLDRVIAAKNGLLEAFFPCPAELREHTAPESDETLAEEFYEKYGASDWYDWCVKNWGTKWDVEFQRIVRESANEVCGAFDSAWAPPLDAFEKMCSLGFEIEAYYYEPGMNFAGIWTGNEDGINDDYYELGEYTSETVRDAIGDELDERFGISEQMAQWEEENQEIDLDGGLSAINEGHEDE